MKDTRINVRIPTAEKELWQQHASAAGMTLSEFVVRSVRTSLAQIAQARTSSNAATSTTLFIDWNATTGGAMKTTS